MAVNILLFGVLFVLVLNVYLIRPCVVSLWWNIVGWMKFSPPVGGLHIEYLMLTTY